MNDALFDLPGIPAAPPEVGLSAQQKLTSRQQEALRRGLHPIGFLLSQPLRLHADAAPADDKKAPGLRCRDCRFRKVFGHHTRSYPKCTRAGDITITHGAASDCRAWWSACVHFEPKGDDR